MEIPSYSYYSGVFKGDSIAQGDWDRYSKRAFDALNIACGWRLDGDFPQPDLNRLRDAVCYQAEYYKDNGFSIGTTAGSGESFTVGKVSVSEGAGQSFWDKRGSALHPMAVAILERLGVLVRRVAVCP